MTTAQSAGQGITSVIWLVLVVAVFYFLLIRPQQQRAKQHARLVAETKVGDEVVTIGGLYGTVTKIDEAAVTLEVAKGTSVVISKEAISGKQPSPSEEPEGPAAGSGEES